jgi:hypothetical protein
MRSSRASKKFGTEEVLGAEDAEPQRHDFLSRFCACKAEKPARVPLFVIGDGLCEACATVIFFFRAATFARAAQLQFEAVAS